MRVGRLEEQLSSKEAGRPQQTIAFAFLFFPVNYRSVLGEFHGAGLQAFAEPSV
jgi:hypothetical protein